MRLPIRMRSIHSGPGSRSFIVRDIILLLLINILFIVTVHLALTILYWSMAWDNVSVPKGTGWIPRYYVGENIGYVVGDASNAYGKVISPLWIERGKAANLEYTPENGWDEVG